MGFRGQPALNALFYRTQWLNLDRHGRRGSSSTTGLGDYRLSGWFHLPLLGMLIYANAGAVTTLVGTLVWICSHFLWVQTAPAWWVAVLCLVLFFSSTAYAMAFARQNYQILGWMWLPAALYAVIHDHAFLAALLWTGMCLFGLTQPLFGLIALSPLCFGGQAHYLVWLTGVSIFFTGLRLMPLWKSKQAVSSFKTTSKLIGANRENVRYKRSSRGMRVLDFYFVIWYGLLVGLLCWVEAPWVSLPMVGLGIYIFNQFFVRVADEQSLYILMASLIMVVGLESIPNTTILLVLFLVLNPFGGFLSIQPYASIVGPIRIFSPYDHSTLEKKISDFFKSVPAGARVFFAFQDPQGEYFRIFDGFRSVMELPFYVANKAGFLLFPNWYSVAETNHRKAPSLWGRSWPQIRQQCSRWQADYAVVYRTGLLGPPLSVPSWCSLVSTVRLEFDHAQFDLSDKLRQQTWILVKKKKEIKKCW